MLGISELLVIAVVVLYVLLELVVVALLSFASGTIRILILCRKLVIALVGSPWLASSVASVFLLTNKQIVVRLTLTTHILPRLGPD